MMSKDTEASTRVMGIPGMSGNYHACTHSAYQACFLGGGMGTRLGDVQVGVEGWVAAVHGGPSNKRMITYHVIDHQLNHCLPLVSVSGDSEGELSFNKEQTPQYMHQLRTPTGFTGYHLRSCLVVTITRLMLHHTSPEGTTAIKVIPL